MFCFKGRKFTTPICRFRRFIAVSNDPAAAWSAANEEFCAHTAALSGPFVGATNTPFPMSPAPISSLASANSSPPAPKSRSRSSSSPAPHPPAPASSSISISESPNPLSDPKPPSEFSTTSFISGVVLNAFRSASSGTAPSSRAWWMIPFETCKSGQFSSVSRKIGFGGDNKHASLLISGISTDASVRAALIRSASSARPCVAAATYARDSCPTCSRILTRSETSPKYKAL
mmetsp:Transcript_41337/g.66410  ORF Transcript_41337/g.66410 Transcript_41337/m.66410 type:complete len:231 (+) Transcript_41337:4097-4789(+)